MHKHTLPNILEINQYQEKKQNGKLFQALNCTMRLLPLLLQWHTDSVLLDQQLYCVVCILTDAERKKFTWFCADGV